MFRAGTFFAIVVALLVGTGTATSQVPVKDLLDEGNRLYTDGKYKEAIAKLEEASAASPGDPRIFFNIAASYYKLEDRPKAVEYLDKCKDALAGKGDSSMVEELREVVSSGEEQIEFSDPARTAANAVNKAMQSSSSPKPDQVTNYAQIEAQQQELRCKVLKDYEPTLPKTGAVLFNLAKCAEDEGRIEEASNYFNQYLQKAPKSLDSADVQLRAADLAALASLSDESGKQVREHYSRGLKFLATRRYARALEEFHSAEKIAPDLPQTQFKLGLMYQAMGKVQEAKDHFERHLKLESRAEIAKPTVAFLASMDERKQKYDELVQAAREQFKPSVQMPILEVGQVDPLIQKLESAVSIYPLSAEANSMLAVAYLHGNNPDAARRPLDVVAGNNSPVFFYGTAARKWQFRFSKVEITPQEMRIIYLNRPNPSKVKAERKKNPVLPTKASELSDHLANISGPSAAILTAEANEDVVVIPASSIKWVHTNNSTVLIDTTQGKYTLYPRQSNFRDIPYQGPAARKYANPYTRFFSQYMGVDEVKLGKESLTGGEKFMIGMEVFSAAAGAFSGTAGMSNVSNSIRVMQSVQAATMALTILQQNRLQNSLLLQRTQFKVIPSTAMQFVFRVEDFK